MQILQCTELNTVTQMPGDRGIVQQMRKERKYRRSMQTKIQQQMNSEKTSRRNSRTRGKIKRVGREYTSHKRYRNNRRKNQTLYCNGKNKWHEKEF